MGVVEEFKQTLKELVTTARGWRTVAFLVAAAFLLGGARNGVSAAALYVLFGAYLIVATLWVRGQYADARAGTPWIWSWVVSLALVIVGAAGLAIYVRTTNQIEHRGGLGVYGALLAYLGLGALITKWRHTPQHRTRVGVIFVVLGVVLSLIGAALLGHISATFPVVLLASGALLAGPIGMNLLAEQYIGTWAGTGAADPDKWWRRGGLLAGVAVFAVIAIGAGLLAHSRWATIAVVVLGLLVVALVSSTQADIAVLLAVVALLGITAREATVPPGLSPAGKSRVLVALGDSYMSGEGASIYYKGTDEGGGDTCRRAPTAWAALAGLQDPFDGMAFLACSGARTRNVLREDTSLETTAVQTDEPGTQLAQYEALQSEAPFTPSLVVLSIGGNDAGFSTIGLMCVAPGNCKDKSDLWLDSLDQLEALLKETYDQVDAEFPGTPVLVTAYPDPIDNRHGDDRCGQVALVREERDFVAEFLHKLNERIEKQATSHHFYYLGDMANALADANLQLCDPLNDGRPGVNFIGLRSVNGLAEQRFNPGNWSHTSLHPNERGHFAMLRTFEHWLAVNGPLKALPARTSVLTTTRADLTAPENSSMSSTPCDLLDEKTQAGCRPQGNKWMQEQLGGFLLRWAWWLVLLAAAAAWFAAVGIFAVCRRGEI